MTINKSTTVAFTGYRAAKILAPSQNPLTLQELQNKIINDIIPVIENLYSQGYRTFLSGMSDGFDMWAYYDGKYGGTMYTFNRAKQHGLSISNIKK